MQIVKSEWHQVEKRYGLEFNEAVLSEIYPDYEESEITQLLADLESGEADYEEVINDAWNNDVELEWDWLNDDDWWTDRKGGYEVTYSAEEWEVRQEYVSPTVWKCTSCKWIGDRWSGNTVHCREDGTVIEDYYMTEEEAHHTKELCPMCDSDTDYVDELTREREETEKRESEERMARWAKEAEENETPERRADLAAALEELKREFDELMSHTHKCTQCDWEGKEEHLVDGNCPDCSSEVQLIERADDE